jgi:TRAP-type C4-dicarboxylate transport system permease small subunit
MFPLLFKYDSLASKAIIHTFICSNRYLRMTLIQKFNNLLERILYWLTAMSTMVFVVFVLLSVITRYITRTPVLSSIEVSRLFFVWACFLAATLAYRRNFHISISFLVDRFSARARSLIETGIQALTVIFFLVIFSESVQVVKLLWYTHLPLSGLSQSWLYMPVPFISVVLIFFAAEKFMENIKSL